MISSCCQRTGISNCRRLGLLIVADQCHPAGVRIPARPFLQICHPAGVRIPRAPFYKYATPLGCGSPAPLSTNMPPRWGAAAATHGSTNMPPAGVRPPQHPVLQICHPAVERIFSHLKLWVLERQTSSAKLAPDRSLDRSQSPAQPRSEPAHRRSPPVYVPQA
jgi:hypothetical protein